MEEVGLEAGSPPLPSPYATPTTAKVPQSTVHRPLDQMILTVSNCKGDCLEKR